MHRKETEAVVRFHFKLRQVEPARKAMAGKKEKRIKLWHIEVWHVESSSEEERAMGKPISAMAGKEK